MQAYNECIAVVMSPDERTEMMDKLELVWGHLEGYFNQCGDVEADSEDAKLMDAMSYIERLHSRLKNGKSA